MYLKCNGSLSIWHYIMQTHMFRVNLNNDSVLINRNALFISHLLAAETTVNSSMF